MPRQAKFNDDWHASFEVQAFTGELSQYRTSRGAIQFPIDQPMPGELIQKIVKYRVEQNAAKGKKK